MSYFICSITKNFTNNPIICKKNGLIYDENILKAYLTKKDTCPITNIILYKDDLIKIKTENNQNDNLNFNKKDYLTILENIEDINKETDLLKIKNNELSIKLSDLIYEDLAYKNLEENLNKEIEILQNKFNENFENNNWEYIHLKTINIFYYQIIQKNYENKVIKRKNNKVKLTSNIDLLNNYICNLENNIKINYEIFNLYYFNNDDILAVVMTNGLILLFKDKIWLYQDILTKEKIIKILHKNNKFLVKSENNFILFKYDELLNNFNSINLNKYKENYDFDFFEELDLIIILDNNYYWIMFDLNLDEIIKIKFKKKFNLLTLHIDEKLIILSNEFGNLYIYDILEKEIVLSVEKDWLINDNKFLLSLNNAANWIFGNEKYLFNYSLIKQKIINRFENTDKIESIFSDLKGFNLLINSKDNIFILDNKFEKIISLKEKFEINNNPKLLINQNYGYLVDNNILNILCFIENN